jgi:CHAD domain-containing protein
VGEYAAAELARRFAKFCSQAKKLERLSPQRLHEERIRAKKLRYGAQFFETLADGGKAEKSARKMIKHLSDVQTALGEVQDAETRCAFLGAEAMAWTQAGHGDSARLMFAAGKLAAQHPARDALVKTAARAARKACDLKPFWDSF